MEPDQDKINIFNTNDDLVVNYNNALNQQAVIRIYNLTGQQVLNNIVTNNGTYHYSLYFASGVYMVSIINSTRIYNKKIFLYNHN